MGITRQGLQRRHRCPLLSGRLVKLPVSIGAAQRFRPGDQGIAIAVDGKVVGGKRQGMDIALYPMDRIELPAAAFLVARWPAHPSG